MPDVVGRSEMTEQALDLLGTLRAIRRRWRPLVLLFVTGVAGGVLVTLLQPTVFVARSGVLFPPSPVDERGNALRDMRTEVNVALSQEILSRTAKALKPPVKTSTLRKKIQVRALSGDILEVRAQFGSARRAVAVADTLAGEYVAYSNSATSAEADTTIALLQEQAGHLDQRTRQLNAEIAASTMRLAAIDQRSAQALIEASRIDSLRAQEVDTARELSTVNNRIAEARLNSQLSRRGTRVLKAPNPEPPSRLQPVRNAGVGGLVGLVAGGILALALEQGRPRLHRRDDLAKAAGAPVLASLTVPVRSGARTCRALLERWEPSVVEKLALEGALTRAGVADGNPPANLVVVVLPGDRRATLVPVQLAAFAATTDTRTALIVPTDHRALNHLRRACSSDAEVPHRIRRNLSVRCAPTEDEEDLGGSELSIAVVLADPGPVVIPTWGRRTSTVLAVSAGFAPAERLVSVAGACLEAGHRVRGVMLANPRPDDSTTGQIALRWSPTEDRRPGHQALSSPALPS